MLPPNAILTRSQAAGPDNGGDASLRSDGRNVPDKMLGILGRDGRPWLESLCAEGANEAKVLPCQLHAPAGTAECFHVISPMAAPSEWTC